jgi:SAM-dependent methyltransferase
MKLAELQQHWDGLGAQDPLFNILTVPGKEGHRWDVDQFFATGRRDVEQMLRVAGDCVPDMGRTRALDFGCGVGRISQALCHHFEEVHGVDIAASMLRLAERHNAFPERCHYHHNNNLRLEHFGEGTFDFVCSLITLQHMEPRHAQAYLREFCRVLAPGGVLFVQIPSERLHVTPRRIAGGWAMLARRVPGRLKMLLGRRGSGGSPRAPRPTYWMEMHVIPRRDVQHALERSGARVVHVLDDGRAGPHFVSRAYVGQKLGTHGLPSSVPTVRGGLAAAPVSG